MTAGELRRLFSIHPPPAGVFLHCPRCHRRYSCDPRDYFMCGPKDAIDCESCRSRLVLARTVVEDWKPPPNWLVREEKRA